MTIRLQNLIAAATVGLVQTLFAAEMRLTCEFMTDQAKQNAPDDSSDVYKVLIPRLSSAPVVDGDPSDKSWRSISYSSEFVWVRSAGNQRKRAVANQDIPYEKRLAPHEVTRIKAGYDNDALYVTFDCRESQMRFIKSGEKDRSVMIWQDDCIQMMLNPDGDQKRSYWHFLMNTVNARHAENRSWSFAQNKQSSPADISGVVSAVARHADGWAAEIKIPWSALHTTMPSPGSHWNGNFCREQQPRHEATSLAEMLLQFHEPDRFAWLYFGQFPEMDIRNFRWGEALPGDNQVTLNLHDLRKNKSSVQGVVSFNGKVIGKKELNSLSEGAAQASIPYTLPEEYEAGKMVFLLRDSEGGPTLDERSQEITGIRKKLGASLTQERWLSPVEALAGQFTLLAAQQRRKGWHMEVFVDGTKISEIADFPAPLAHFRLSAQKLKPGRHVLNFRLMEKQDLLETVNLPFVVEPGAFDLDN